MNEFLQAFPDPISTFSEYMHYVIKILNHGLLFQLSKDLWSIFTTLGGNRNDIQTLIKMGVIKH